MQELRNGYLSSFILFMGITLSLIAHGLEIELENVSPQKQQELENLFSQSAFNAKNPEKLQQKNWTCDMYGVRTRLQVKRGVKLYRWNSASWHNEGSQPVEDYKPDVSELVGLTPRFEDRVRVTKDGHIISQLSVTHPSRQVVAYSLCSTP